MGSSLPFTQPTFAELAYLAAIEPDGTTIGELARIVGRSQSATSRMVKALWRHGLVTITIDDDPYTSDTRFRIVRRVER